MAKIVNPITAKIEVVGKLKEGDFGAYCPVLFIDLAKPEGSEEAKIWKSLSADEAAPLRRGATVQLIPAGTAKNGKEKHNILLMDAPPAPPSTPAPTTGHLSLDQKRAIAAYVDGMGDLLKYCRDTAIAKLGDCDEETIRCSTASLFIAASRKFNL